MVNKTLRQVIDNIYVESENLENQIKNEKDGYRKINLEFQLNTVENEKLHKVYLEMLDKMPEQEYVKLRDTLVDVMGSEGDFERLTKNILTHYPNASFKDFCMGIPSIIVTKNLEKLVDSVSRFVSDKEMDKVAENVKNYIPGSINNTPIHPCAKIIEEIKNGEKFNSLPEEKKLEISKQLDEINEVVKESPRKYSEEQTNFDAKYEHITNAANDELCKNYINEENKDFGKAYIYREPSFLIKDDVADDQEKMDIAKSPSFKLTSATQESILKVWKKMDELGIISAGEGQESGAKIYGFEKLYKVRTQIDNALRDEQFDNLKELKEEYEKQLQNIRDMYKIIKEELNPTPAKIPGNVQNFRENFVPAEFKNDICTNATFNGMYNTYSIVKSMGISAEEFLRNPQEFIDKKFNDELTKFYIDKLFKDTPFDETLLRVYIERSRPGLNSHGLPRMISTLSLFEKDDEQRKNDIIYHGVQSGKIETIFDDVHISYNYFTKERTNTFVNLLFANPEDKNFDHMRSYESVTGDKMHKIKAFDFADYMKEKKIPAEVINERITDFLEKAYKFSYGCEKAYKEEKLRYDKQMKAYKEHKIEKAPKCPTLKGMSKEEFVQMTKDVQQGIIAYAMIASPEMSKGMDKLVELLKDPAEALNKLNMDDSFVEKLETLKNKDVVLDEYKQRAKIETTLNIKDIRAKENTYNKSVDRILKEAEKISVKVANESDEKKIEELQKQSVLKMNELKVLQKAETERLDKECKAGNIPSEYFKNRVENILGLKHNDKIAIFDDGINKEEYIKSTGLEGLSKGEKDKLFESEILRQKAEKENFINKQFLQKNNLISANKDIDIKVQKANFEQIDVTKIDSVARDNQREPIVVNEAKIEGASQKTEPQKEIEPKQTVKLP